MEQFKLKNGDTIVIRKANKLDGKAMLNYIHQVSAESEFLTFGKGEFHRSIEEEEDFIDHIAKQDNALFIIAETGGKIVGNLNFSGGLRPRIMHRGEFGVSVLKEYWNQGIATKLIQYLIKWCKESQTIRKINLRVRSDHDSAIHLYQKLGFQIEGHITREFLINGTFYDAICMGQKID